MRYALTIQYIGRNYYGSQIQFENGEQIKNPTIQGELEKALCTLIYGKTDSKNRYIKTIFSGRTDKGVNAKGQVVHFDCEKKIVASDFLYKINEILPNDISVSEIREVNSRFHSQKSAKQLFSLPY